MTKIEVQLIPSTLKIKYIAIQEVLFCSLAHIESIMKVTPLPTYHDLYFFLQPVNCVSKDMLD